MSDVSPLYVYLPAYVDKMTLHGLGDAAAALDGLTPQQLLDIHVIDPNGKVIDGLEAVKLVTETLLRISHKAENALTRRYRGR